MSQSGLAGLYANASTPVPVDPGINKLSNDPYLLNYGDNNANGINVGISNGSSSAKNLGNSNGVPTVLAPGGSTVEVDPSLWQAGGTAATQTAAQDYGYGLAAQSQQTPTINNPNAGQSVGALDATRAQYGELDRSLANTAAGGGVNAGQAQFAQGQTSNIASQLAAAHGAHGGYSLGSALGAQNAGAAAMLGNAQQGAGTTGQQVGAAQGALGTSLNAQGQMNLAEYGTQQNAAASQAGLAEAQQQMNNGQTNAWDQNSLAQQGAQLNAINESGQASAAARGLSISQQQINNQQLGTELGSGLKTAGTVASIAALA